MRWILKITSPSGEVFYSEAKSGDGNRRLCADPKHAEQFESRTDVESALIYFQLLWEFRGHQHEAVEHNQLDDQIQLA
ncbi:hypothetical protein C4J83_2751 [Pseudomonas sp. LBUM920]|jgi:hypothetical protein|nr:hypothetical protein C4J83_2751 [Pseudomonas sp. LBUM920]